VGPRPVWTRRQREKEFPPKPGIEPQPIIPGTFKDSKMTELTEKREENVLY